MRIVIAGCWRTGTTGLFNLLRIMLERDGSTYSCFEDDYRETVGYKHQLIKAHKFRKKWVEWASPVPAVNFQIMSQALDVYEPQKCIITTYRDSQDIVDSMERFRESGADGNATDTQNIIRGLEHAALWNKYSCYMALFRRIDRSPEKLADHLAAMLCLSVNPRVIVKEWKKITPPKEGYDNRTLLHANHITR